MADTTGRTVTKKRRFRTDAALMLFNRVFQMGSRMVIVMLMARLVSKTEVGVYFLVLQVVTVARLLAEAGLPVGLQKLIAVAAAEEHFSRVRRYATVALGIVVAMSAVLGLVIAAAWPWIVTHVFEEPLLSPFLWVALLLLLMHGIEDLGSSYFRSRHQIAKVAIFIGTPRNLFLLVSLMFAYVAHGSIEFYWLMILVLCSWVLSGITSLTLAAVDVGSMPSQPAAPVRKVAREMLALCLPMMLHSGALLLFSSANLWVLGIFRGTDEVGIFGATVRLSASMAMVLTVINLIMPPHLARMHAQGKTLQMEALLRKSAAVASLIATPATAILVAFARPILRVAFTSEYEAGAPALALLALGYGFNAFVGSAGYVLQMTGDHVRLLRITVVTAGINLVAVLLLAPRYGITGAAIASSGSLIAQNIYLIIVVRQRHRIWTVPRFSDPFYRRKRGGGQTTKGE